MKRLLVVGLVVFVSLLVSMNVLYTPIPNMDDDTVFNTKIAIEHIAEISQEPHSVYDPIEHEEVRLYLKEQLVEYVGLTNVYEYNYEGADILDDEGNPLEYDVQNLLAVIPGTSDTAIMVVAHYDSRGHIGRSGELGNSFGAADDGYGIALMLEIARIYGQEDLENTVYILMTDAEETGLYGAKMASQEDFMDQVSFVINIEARGVQGPAYMFETSINNEKVIDFYKEANLPVSYSLATAVYTVMPNSTDFTEFLGVGKQGVNFAVLNGLFNYHTPFDNFTAINPSSIEHYGTQILPMVDEFIMNPIYSDVDYFVGSQNQIFFTFLPNVFITYTEATANVLHILVLVLFIGLSSYIFYKKQTTWKHVGIGIASFFILMFGIILLGNIVSRIIAWMSKVPFNLTYVRTTIGDLPALITLVGIVVISGWIYHKHVTTKERRLAIIMTGTLINALLALLTGYVLSGASFLFLIPAISGLLILQTMTLCRFRTGKYIILSIVVFINIVVLVPIVYSLYLALTIGGLLALGVIVLFYLYTLIPSVLHLFE